MSPRVIFNLNGRKFEIGKEMFLRILDCKHLELPEAEKSNTKSTEYFLERHAESFEAILDYLQHGKLHLPPNICPWTFKRELEFWGIDARVMSPCCYRKYLTFFEDEKGLQEFRRMTVREQGENSSRKSIGCRSSVWQLLDDPSSSFGAKVYLGVSTIFVLLSLFVLAATTHQAFRRDLNEKEWKEAIGETKYELFKHRLPHLGNQPFPDKVSNGNRLRRSATQCHCQCHYLNETESTTVVPPDSTDPPDLPTDSMYARTDYLTYIEYATAVFFSLELVMRIIFAPNKCRFFTGFLNIMDVVALLAMYSTILVVYCIPSEKYNHSISAWIEGLQVVRVFRVFRILKDVVGFRVLLYSVQSSIREILLLVLYLSIGTILFANVIYFLERDNMESIPDAAWWVVVTMTTVGYGDMAPISFQGKLVGCMCAICGVFLIAVTVPIFVSNFILYYSYSKVVGEMNKASQTERLTDRQDGDQELVKMVRPESLKKNKIDPKEVVLVEDYM